MRGQSDPYRADRSPLVRGERIEIMKYSSIVLGKFSSPLVRGEWIEIAAS